MSLPLRIAALVLLTGLAAACQLPTLFTESIEGHLEVRVTADRHEIGPSDSVMVTFELVSMSSRPMRLSVFGGSCFWRAYAMETDAGIHPEVWIIRPSGRIECQQSDDLELSLGPGEVVHLGTIHWDGTDSSPAGAERLSVGSYHINAMVEAHEVRMDGETYRSERGVYNTDTLVVRLIDEGPAELEQTVVD